MTTREDIATLHLIVPQDCHQAGHNHLGHDEIATGELGDEIGKPRIEPYAARPYHYIAQSKPHLAQTLCGEDSSVVDHAVDHTSRDGSDEGGADIP